MFNPSKTKSFAYITQSFISSRLEMYGVSTTKSCNARSPGGLLPKQGFVENTKGLTLGNAHATHNRNPVPAGKQDDPSHVHIYPYEYTSAIKRVQDGGRRSITITLHRTMNLVERKTIPLS